MFNFIKRILGSERGTASASKSAAYQNYDVLGLPFSGLERRGRVITISDTYTVGTGTYTTGTTDTVSGVVKLFTHKAGWKCVWAAFSTDGLSASAGVGQTPVVGDGTTANKYMAASDMDAASIYYLAPTGHLYTPSADVTVTLTFGATGTPIAGQLFKYSFVFVSN